MGARIGIFSPSVRVLLGVQRFQPGDLWIRVFHLVSDNFGKEAFFALPGEFLMLLSFIAPGDGEDVRTSRFHANLTSLYDLRLLWPDDLATRRLSAQTIATRDPFAVTPSSTSNRRLTLCTAPPSKRGQSCEFSSNSTCATW